MLLNNDVTCKLCMRQSRVKVKDKYTDLSSQPFDIIVHIYSRTSNIRNLDYPAWQFSCYQIRKWACPSNAHAHCSCYHGDMPAYLLRMRIQPCALLFINKVGGSRRGLSIRLSDIFTYPACFWNQGVRIIEVLLYKHLFHIIHTLYIVNSSKQRDTLSQNRITILKSNGHYYTQVASLSSHTMHAQERQ